LTAGADAVARVAEQLALAHAAESGKVIGQARHEVDGAVAMLRAIAELARLATSDVAPTGAVPGGEADLTLVERVPLGVVVCIIPFNFPVELTVEKAGTALAAGNVAIVKPPPQNPHATLTLGSVLVAAGLPDDVLQVAPGGAPFSEALASAPGVDAVSLTGSPAAGVAVARATASMLRPLHLELGGNGAAIVLPDADVDHVVTECLRGRLLMNGQACAGTKRIVVVGSARDVTERLATAIDRIVVGPPCDPSSSMSHLIDARAAVRVAEQVGRAVAQGAALVRGGGVDGAWMSPTLLADVPSFADVAVDDEIFGPVFTVVPVRDEAEAIAVNNASALGLTAAVFSPDLQRAVAVGRRLAVGGVVINGTNNYRPPVVPFGGVGLAGSGREGLGYTMDELTRTRFLAVRRFFVDHVEGDVDG
jgi:acyl-CoA reductase-like NAD-dependent aldehyde dehydrogenase